MKKAIIEILIVIVVIFGCLQFVNIDTNNDGIKDDFSAYKYIENISTVEPIPKFPNLSSYTVDEAGLLENIGSFFQWFYQVMKYPVNIIVWFITMIGQVFGGKIVL